MNRATYYSYIEEKLTVLMHRIKQRGKLNLLDLNIYSENFFADLLNIVLKYRLVNMNLIEQNVEAIDLRDETNKVLVQVTSTCTKEKINKTLDKKILKEYSDLKYRIKFMTIGNDRKKLLNITYENPHDILFDPKQDIIDINAILANILNMNIDEQIITYEFIKSELGQERDILKIDSNLATIINILSNENLSQTYNKYELDEFNIEKKIEFNNIKVARAIIDDYKVYYSKVDEKYREFDMQGNNKSMSVFQVIKKQYISLEMQKIYNEDQLFLKIIESIIYIIQNSRNYNEIPYEELEMCVGIIVVDAFIRCKIFKNPEGYSHVITR